MIMTIHISSTLNTLSTYKENISELGIFLLKSFEVGNRVFMIARGYTNHNLKMFVNEFKNQESIENIIIYDEEKKIIASAYEDKIPEIQTEINDIVIEYNKKNIFIVVISKQ